MPYTNLAYSSTQFARDYVDINWVQYDKTTFLKKHVLARGAYFVLAPASLITHAIDTIIGLGVGLAAICTLGKHKPTLNVAQRHLYGAKELLVSPYVNILQTINPEAKFPQASEYRRSSVRSSTPPLIDKKGVGFISHIFNRSLLIKARQWGDSNNFLKRHVASRLTYALLAVSFLITRAVDGIISIPAAGLSLLTLGKFGSLNNLAYRSLQAPVIISDLFECTLHFINPQAPISCA